MNNLLEIHDLDIRFRVDRKSEPFRAVKGISFDIPSNSTVALVGESGSGKSVSAMALLGLLPENAVVAPESRALYGGQDLLKASMAQLQAIRGKDISVIFQEPMTSLNPVFPVGEQIAEALRLHMGLGMRQARARAIELLGEVGIPDPQLRIDSFPHEMSGGQQQRVMIAMAISCEPKLLIADEPTTALDVTIQKQILELIAKLQQQHRMSVLFITHDLGVVGEIADHVVVMQNGEIQEQGPVRAIFESPQHPYTKALLACRPRLDRRPKRLPVIDDFMRGGGHVHLEERHRGILPGDDIILEVKGLTKTFFLKEGLFGKRAVPAVKDVSFRLPKGKTLGLVGESGSGKTTVGLTVMRLHEATAGEVLFEGRDLLTLTEREMMAYRRRIQIIFQNPYASLNPRFTVGQILVEPMRIHRIGRDERERVSLAFQLLKRVGLEEQSFYKYPHEFSGGQRQRIALARAMVLRPRLVVLDEPTSALDMSVQAQIVDLLRELQQRYTLAYIFISHDLRVIRALSDEVIVMKDGRVVEEGPSAAIFERPREPYTRALMTAAFELETSEEGVVRT